MTKTCKICGNDKELDDFLPQCRGPRKATCRLCANRIVYERKKESLRQNIEKRIAYWKRRAETRGILIDEAFDRAMDHLYDGCEICGRNDSQCLDHDHNTGKVRGVLCANCNIMLGHAKDNQKILLCAAEYLNKKMGNNVDQRTLCRP